VASRRSTVKFPLAPSTFTSPKCWKPPAGEVLAAGGTCMNTASGPNVGSSLFGPNAPAEWTGNEFPERIETAHRGTTRSAEDESVPQIPLRQRVTRRLRGEAGRAVAAR
jgi:hypothetical protein